MTLREAIHLLPALPSQSQIVVVCPGKSICVQYNQQFGYTITMSEVCEGVASYRECECGALILPSERHQHTWARTEAEDTVRQWVGEDEVKEALLVVPFPYYEAEFPISL
jgi:hypothetical protein